MTREEQAVYNRAYQAKNRDHIREQKKAYRAAHRDEIAAYMLAYRKAHRDKFIASGRAYYNAHREEVIAKSAALSKKHPVKSRSAKWSSHLRRKYGLSMDDFVSMQKAQKGRCAICHQGAKKLGVDHNHETGAVRGLLCSQCNQGLGNMHDSCTNLRAAIRYLEAYK